MRTIALYIAPRQTQPTGCLAVMRELYATHVYGGGLVLCMSLPGSGDSAARAQL